MEGDISFTSDAAKHSNLSIRPYTQGCMDSCVLIILPCWYGSGMRNAVTLWSRILFRNNTSLLGRIGDGNVDLRFYFAIIFLVGMVQWLAGVVCVHLLANSSTIVNKY